MNDADYIQQAIDLARDNVASGGQPFGAVLVRDGKVIARAANRMEADNDPTAHAELVALRLAGAALGTTRLDGAIVYASGQPCMMCLAAMRRAGVSEIIIGYSDASGAAYGMSPAAITAELSQPIEGQTWARIRHLAPDDAADPEIYRLYAAKSAERT